MPPISTPSGLWLLFELAGAGQERLAVGLLEQDPALDVRAGERERLLECVIDPLLAPARA